MKVAEPTAVAAQSKTVTSEDLTQGPRHGMSPDEVNASILKKIENVQTTGVSRPEATNQVIDSELAEGRKLADSLKRGDRLIDNSDGVWEVEKEGNSKDPWLFLLDDKGNPTGTGYPLSSKEVTRVATESRAVRANEVPTKVIEPTEKGGGFSGALNEGSKAANTPDWVAGQFDAQIAEFDKLARDTNAAPNQREQARVSAQHFRDLRDKILNPNQGAAEIAPAPMTASTPVRVYHGATQPFEEFNTPAYFSTDAETARGFAERRAKDAGEENPNPRLVTADIHFKNPVVIDAEGDFAGNLQFGLKAKAFRDALKDSNSDGIILKNTKDEGDVYVAKDKSTIKQVPVVATPTSKLHFAASKAGLEYKGPLEGGNGQVFHTFDDPTKPGDQITVRESELPATGVADFLKQKMEEKRATTESLRQDVLNRVKGEVGQPQVRGKEKPRFLPPTENEPPKGYIRIYRGVNPERNVIAAKDPTHGNWYTTSYDDAVSYANWDYEGAGELGPNRAIRAVDVPLDDAFEYAQAGSRRRISSPKELLDTERPVEMYVDDDVAAGSKHYEGDEVESEKGTIGQPQAKLLEAPIPKKYAKQGFTTQSTINHELGHSIVGDAVGMEPGEIRTHLHPSTIEQGAIAQAAMDYTPVGGEGERITYEDARPVFVDKFVPLFYAGGVAQELLDGIPISANEGMFGDIKAIHDAMGDMGFSDRDIALAKELGEAQARKNLDKTWSS